MADYTIVEEALKRGYTMDEIADNLARDNGVDPADARGRGYTTGEMMKNLGYVKPETSDVARGFVTSFKQLPQLGYGLLAGAGAVAESVAGEGGVSTSMKNFGVKKYQEAGADIEKDSKQSDSLSYSWEQAKQGDFGSLVDWLQYGIGYGGGQAVQALATAGVGSLVGKTVLKGTAENLASKMVAKEALRLGATEEAKRLTAQEISKIAVANVASNIGQTVAIGSQAFGMEGGEIFGDLAQKTVKEGRAATGGELAKAFGATAAAGALEFVGDKLGVDVMLGKSKMFKPASSMTGVGGRAARAAVAVPGTVLAEGGTEYLQTGIEEYGKGNEKNFLPFMQSESAQKQALDAAGLGAVGGGGMAMVGGAFSSPQKKDAAPSPSPSISSAQTADDAIAAFQDEVASVTPRGSFGSMDDLAGFIESERSDLGKRRGLLAQQQQEARDMEAEFSGLVKDEQIDQSYRLNDAQKQRDAERAREGGYDLALQQREEQQGRTVEQLAAASEAQGFGNEEPTAMQLAMQQAQQKALDNEFSGLLKQERASLNEMRANVKRVAGVPVEQISTPQLEEIAQSEAHPNTKMAAVAALNDRHDAIQQERERLMQLRETRLEKQSNQPEQGAQHGAESHGADGQMATPSVAGGSNHVPGGGLDAAVGNVAGSGRINANPPHVAQGSRESVSVPNADSQANVRALTENAAKRQATQLTNQGFPTVAYPHPTQPGMWAIGSHAEAKSAPAKEQQAQQAQHAPVEPAADDVPVINVRQQTPRKKPASNTLAQAIINLGGISTSLKQDITGDASVRSRPGLFTKNGTADLGELAARLSGEFGFTQIDVNDPEDNSGAKQLADLIASSVNGETILNEEAMIRAQQDEEFEQAKAEVNLQAQEIGIKPIRGKRTIDIVQSEINAILAEREEMSRQKQEAQRLLDEVAEQELIDAFNLQMQEYHDENAITRDERREESARLSAEESAQGDGDSVDQASPVAGRASPTEGGRGEAEVTPEFGLVGQTEEEAIAEEQARRDVGHHNLHSIHAVLLRAVESIIPDMQRFERVLGKSQWAGYAKKLINSNDVLKGFLSQTVVGDEAKFKIALAKAADSKALESIADRLRRAMPQPEAKEIGDFGEKIGAAREGQGAEVAPEFGLVGGKSASEEAKGKAKEELNRRDAQSNPRTHGVNYADDFAIRPVEIIEHLISTGNIKALYKAAVVKTADAFSALPMDQRSKAYAQYVEDGGQPAPPATEAYNDKVSRMEREALVRRLQSDATVLQANGKPFKTEVSAKEFSARNELDDTHEVSKVESGYVLKRLPEARRPSVIKSIEDRQANDPENQRQERAFSRAAKIGAAANEAVTAYENGETSIEQFEAALDAVESANDKDHFTLERLNRDDNSMESVTFERGEYVRYLTSGDHSAFGEIDGISHARREFSVGKLWYPFGAAYKAERPAEAKPETVPLSSVIDKVNSKYGEGLTEEDRVPTPYTIADKRSSDVAMFSRGRGNLRSRPRGEITHETQRLEKEINRDLSRQGKEAIWATGFITRSAVPDNARRLVAAVEKLFGVRVEFVQVGDERANIFNGVFLGGNTLFVNVDSSSPVSTVIGHEFLHFLKESNPDLYAKAESDLLALANAKKFAAAATKHQPAMNAGEEVIADTFGDQFSNPEFWEEMANRVEPSLFMRIRAAFTRFMGKLLGEIKAMGTTHKTDALYSDLDAVRDAVLSATVGAAKGRKLATPSWSNLHARFMTAWHGSPHDHDGFDSSKIGTGEGAQAYGWGLYFAGSREVAEYYKNTTSIIRLTGVDGKKYGDTQEGAESTARALLANYKNDRKTFDAFDDGGQSYMGKIARDIKNGIIKEASGRLYQVELAPTEDELLDWDKTYSEQSDFVKKALGRPNEWLKLVQDHGNRPLNGLGIYKSLEDKFISDKQASEHLRSLGIRGIKYLDGMSRSAGEGSQNYVIFDDADVKITAKESRRASNSETGSTINTIAAAIRKTYGDVLDKLQAKNLITLTQTQDEAIEAAAKARAKVTGERVEDVKRSLMASVKNQAVWHGTPHRGIEKTGFRLIKIGTGEGAQAYGWGIYFASHRVVAEGYRQSTSRPEVEIGGRRFKADGGGIYRDDTGIPLGSTNTMTHDDAARGLYGSKANQPIEVLAEEAESYLQSRSWMTNERIAAAKKAILNGEVKLINEGQLYSADIPENDELLDWDNPLSEQPGKVREAIKAIKSNTPKDMLWMWDGVTPQTPGRQLYGMLGELAAEMNPEGADDLQQAASELMLEHGIPGLRYLDGNSRGNDEGTHNYVIWDEAQLTPEAAQIEPHYSKNGDIEGFFDPVSGKSFLIADALTEETAPGTLMHEVGIHMAAEKDGPMQKLIARAGKLRQKWANNKFVQEAEARMREAGETSDEEFLAYTVTQYENNRAGMPVTLVSLAKDFIAAVKAWMFNKGYLQASKLTVADLAAIARANARKMARGMEAGANAGANTRQSVAQSKEAREFAETERAYGGREAYDRAKADGKTKLGYRQWVQVRTDSFKKWFGDWENDTANASKVVDPNTGEPLVVYHGTAADFDAFDKKKSGAVWSSDKEGFFFSSESSTASEYADFASSQTVGAANVMPVYVSLKNPLTLEKFAEITNGIRLRQRHGDGADALTRFFDDERDLLVRYAKQEKNDGILLEKDGKMLVVAFRPEQVKSATGNVGTFGESDDIRFSRAGNGTSNYVIFDSADVKITAKESRRASNDLDFTQPKGPEPLRKTSFGYANDTYNIFHATTINSSEGDIHVFHVHDPVTGDLIGSLGLGLNGDEITVLYNIKDETNSGGFGEKILRSLLAGSKDGLYIVNMLPDAVGFWKKMGVSLDDHLNGAWEHGNGILTEQALTTARGEQSGARESKARYEQAFSGGGGSEKGGEANKTIPSGQVTNETTPANAGVSVSAPTESVRRIQAVVERFKSQFKGASALDIRVVSTTFDIPARFRPSPFAEGVFHDDAGLVYLVTMNLHNPRGELSENRAWQVLLHESVGHYGLSQMIGDKFASILKAVKQATLAGRKVSETQSNPLQPGDKDYTTWEAVKLRYPDATDAELAQEVLARMSETDPGSSVLGYAVAVVRQWVRDVARAMGVNVVVSTSELRDLVAKASGYMRRGDNLADERVTSGFVAASMKYYGLRVVDLFGNGSRVQYFDDKRGLFYEAQKYPSGRIGWRAGEIIDGMDYWLSDKEFGSMEEAQAAVRGLRISNTAKQKAVDRYGIIPPLWTGEAKRVAKAIIDAGIGVERFSASTQSASKYIYLESGLKVRMADHSLPGSYEQPDVDFRYGGDIKALVEEIRKEEEGAPTPSVGPDSTGSRSLGASRNEIQERPAVRADESGSLEEPAQSGGGAGSDAMLSAKVGAGKTAFNLVDVTSAAFKKWFGDSKVVDAGGNPLRVYHGTDADLTEFKRVDSRTGHPSAQLGVFFTASAKVADRFNRVKTDLPFSDIGKLDFAEGANQLPVYLSIKNPAVLSAKEFRDLMVDLGSPPDNVYGWMRTPEGWAALRDHFINAEGRDGVKILAERNVYSGSGLEEYAADQYVAFNPTQIKSAISNTGAFDSTNPSILESRAAQGKPQGPIWNSPESSRADDVIYTMQDKNIDLKRVQQAIKEAVGEIRDDIDTYLQEELFHGRAAKITEEFLDKEVNPLISLMRASKVSMEELETFLWARHAKERNAQIAKINEAMPDGGSGLTNKQADDLMAGKDVKIGDKTIAGVKPARKKLLSDLAGRVDAITRGNRALLERYSLESADTLNAWDGAYKHYVPLHREDAESHLAGMGTGQGYSVKGSSSKRATGSSRPVENILANLALQRERIITRGEKNRVAQSLYGLAKEMPNADLWEVDVKPTMRTTAMVEGREQVVDAVDPNFRNRPNVVFARFNGKDRFIVFNEHNERAVRMAQALKNLDADDISHLLGEVSRWTRYFASINTQYNPIFGVTNLVRDVQTGLLNLKSTPIEGKQKELMGNLTHALPAVFKALRAGRKGQAATGTWAQLWEEFQEVGGQTGYRDMFRNSHERAEALQNALDPTWWQKTWWGKAATVGGVLAVPEQAFLDKFGKPFMELLSDYNTMMENGIRLAAYKVALDTGMTQARAASLAKNLTVNFNRKGQAARQVGAMYAFFNASIQGTARMAETLNHGAKPGELLGKAGKQIVYGGLLLGAVQAMLLMAAGFDDEEPPEFVRDRNIIIPTGNGKYVSIPMPLGFHVLPAISRISIEFTAGGFKKPGEHLVHIMDVLLDSFNPIGNAGLSMQTVAPTVLDPIAALTENKDWSGRQIARQDFSKLNPTPGYTRAKDTASSLSRGLAYALNYLSGGGEYGIGVVSPTPDQIDYLLGQLTGGVGREVGKVLTTGETMATGEDLPPHKIPLVGRFYGDTTGQSSEASKFYGTLEKLSEHRGTLDRMKDAHDLEAYREYAKEHPEIRFYDRANKVQRELSSLRKLKRTMIERNADRAKVRQIEDRMRTLMTRFNQSVSEQEGSHR